MRFTYEDLWQIFAQANRQCQTDYNYFQIESDLKIIKLLEKAMNFIQEGTELVFELKGIKEHE